MRASRPRLLDDSDLYAAALRALTRRAYSVRDMRVYLEARAENKEAVAPVLGRLKELNYLDDGRFARQFVRQRAEGRKQGAYRIARDLRARGVPDRHIEEALAERATETNETAALRMRVARRLKTLRGPLDERRKASLYSSLLRAGFSGEAIRRELRSAARVAVDDLLDPSAETS
jgi:regulatory protein